VKKSMRPSLKKTPKATEGGGDGMCLTFNGELLHLERSGTFNSRCSQRQNGQSLPGEAFARAKMHRGASMLSDRQEGEGG